MIAWGTSPEIFTERLALTLLHFLWEGAAVALAVVIIGGMFRVRRPRSRYVLNLVAMCAMAACPPATFWYLNTLSMEALPTGAGLALTAQASFTPEITQPDREMPIVQRITNLPTHDFRPTQLVSWQSGRFWIILGWVSGVSFFGARLFLGWIWLQGLKNWQEPVPDSMMRQAQSLGRQLHLHVPRIYASRHLSEAIATGLVRPTILIPLAWITELPPDMLEAILAHELAHVSRWDLWVNVFQRIVETLLFYHPAVWWLSRRLRIERELCCDELAVAVTHDRIRYAQTLECVGRLAMRSVPSSLALTIGGNRMNLLFRVKSILDTRPRRLSNLPSLLGILAIVVSLGIWRSLFFIPAPLLNAAEPSELESMADNYEGEQVTGTVVDAVNRPVPDVEVQVYRDGRRVAHPLRTDAMGQFKVPTAWRKLEGDGVTLVVRGDDGLGWLGLTRHRKVIPEDLSIRIVLLPLDRTLKGQVTDSQGHPLTGITIAPFSFWGGRTSPLYMSGFEKDGWVLSSTTDRQGRFSLKLPKGTGGMLRPRHPDWSAVVVRWNQEQTDVGRIVLARAGRIEGRVVEVQTNKPIRGAFIDVRSYSHEIGTQWDEAKSDNDGRFVIAGLEPGDYIVAFAGLAANPKITAPAHEAVTVQAGHTVEVDFRACEGRLLSGTVVDADTAKPRPRCFVSYYGTARPRSGIRCMGAQTDELGRFRFNVPPGVAQLYLSEEGLSQNSSWTTIEVDAERDPDPLVLKAKPVQVTPAASVTTVTDLTFEEHKQQGKQFDFRPNGIFRTANGKPVGQVIRHLVIVGSQHAMLTGLSSGNTFEDTMIGFGSVLEGRSGYYLIDAVGFAPTRTPEFIFSKTIKALTIDLQPEMFVEVRGRVVDVQGKGVTGAHVLATVRAPSLLDFQKEETTGNCVATTNADGSFTLKHLRVGDSFFARAEKEGTRSVQTKTISISNAEPIELPVFRLGPSE